MDKRMTPTALMNYYALHAVRIKSHIDKLEQASLWQVATIDDVCKLKNAFDSCEALHEVYGRLYQHRKRYE